VYIFIYRHDADKGQQSQGQEQQSNMTHTLCAATVVCMLLGTPFINEPFSVSHTNFCWFLCYRFIWKHSKPKKAAHNNKCNQKEMGYFLLSLTHKPSSLFQKNGQSQRGISLQISLKQAGGGRCMYVYVCHALRLSEILEVVAEGMCHKRWHIFCFLNLT